MVVHKKPAWLAPGWLCGGVRLKECVERRGRAHGQPPCLIRTLVCPRLIVSWAPQSKDLASPPLYATQDELEGGQTVPPLIYKIKDWMGEEKYLFFRGVKQ